MSTNGGHGCFQDEIWGKVLSGGRKAGVVILFFLAAAALAGTPLIIDDFDYANDAAAQAAWVPGGSSPQVTMAGSGEWGDDRVMRLPCNFSVQTSRCFWDRTVSFDFSDYSLFALEIFVPDSLAVSYFTLYFHSGTGWYANSVNITRRGWQTLMFQKVEFEVEGTPMGWNQIDRIRLSPWKGASQDTYLAARQLRAFTPDILIIRDDQSGAPEVVERTVDLMSNWLSSWNLLPAVVDSASWQPSTLSSARMAILPYNEVVTGDQMTALEFFVSQGGKLMVHYLLNDGLENLLAIDRTGWTQGDFAAFTFSDPTIQHLPPRVVQDSWNITIAAPRTALNSRVIAAWENSAGIPTGHPAWLASDNGLFFSHIVLEDDPQNKRVMLLALIGHYVPEVWPFASTAAYDDIGRIGEYLGYGAAVAGIHAKGAATPRAPQVEAELAAAETARNLAALQRTAGQHAEAVFSALSAREHLLEAFYLCQSSVLPEFRAVWEHNATGPYPGDWPRAIDAMVTNGFTAVFPNMLWGGLAHYNSALLPHSSDYETYGDQIEACVNAAHSRGIEVHVWKVNYNLYNAPQSFIDSMRAAGRTQVTSTGEPVDWLCPSHPENFALERDSMLEVVRNYDVDGIHFDYIRYPGPEECYCDGCRARFQADTGNTVVNWPGDVLTGGPLESAFLDWRREQITELVEAVYAAVQEEKPQVKVSAAVFSNYSWAFDGVGQDWVDWIDRGIVDFLCPMDYTADHDEFREEVGEQMGFAAGRVPIYPGIGPSALTPALGPDGVIVQISATRDAATGGFIIFELGIPLIGDTFPGLAKGTTLPGKVAETPDGHFVPGTPLTLTRNINSSLLNLEWGAACDAQPGLTDYTIYQGSLASLHEGVYNHVPVVGSTGGFTSATLQVPPDPAFFLIVPNDTSREGGYGFNSAGLPRPYSALPHLPQARTDCP